MLHPAGEHTPDVLRELASTVTLRRDLHNPRLIPTGEPEHPWRRLFTEQTEAGAALMGQEKIGALDEVCVCLIMETTHAVASFHQELINMGE